ncbi:hypothetical protein LTR74_018149 [Friedmanniomyces endolithicus]|nr:hypothetical protein LTR74_018149 [Friedmanniomyces endolithicus]
MVQDRAKHIVRPSFVASVLCYDPTYEQRAIQPIWAAKEAGGRHAHATVVPPTAATPTSGCSLPTSGAGSTIYLGRKRPIASTSEDDETGSPNKRRRLYTLGEESGEFQWAADRDYLPRAESDGTSYSTFRYYGALASTAENNYTYSESSISPTTPGWMPHPERSSNMLTGEPAPSGSPLRARVSSTTAEPDSFQKMRHSTLHPLTVFLLGATEASDTGTPVTRATAQGLKRKRSSGNVSPTEERAINKPRFDAQHGNGEHTMTDEKERSVEDDKLVSADTTACEDHSFTASRKERAGPESTEAQSARHNATTTEQIRSEALSLARTRFLRL